MIEDYPGQTPPLLWQLVGAKKPRRCEHNYQTSIYPILQRRKSDLERIRWTLVEGPASRVSSVFLAALMFWLVIVFFMSGIIAPKNALIYVSILLASLSVSSPLFVILDLDTPLTSLIRVSSQPLRDALMHMDEPPSAP